MKKSGEQAEARALLRCVKTIISPFLNMPRASQDRGKKLRVRTSTDTVAVESFKARSDIFRWKVLLLSVPESISCEERDQCRFLFTSPGLLSTGATGRLERFLSAGEG